MKRNYISSIIFLIVFTACRQPGSNSHARHVQPADTAVYKMNGGILSTISTISADQGKKIFSIAMNGVVTYDSRRSEVISSRVAGRIERLYVKYNFQPVRKGMLIMEIYAPELAAAQRELLYLKSINDTEMFARAEQRLLLLGMSQRDLQRILRTGRILYNVPVYSKVDGYILEGTSPSPATSYTVSSAADNMGTMPGETAAPSTQTGSVPTPSSPATINFREGQYVAAGQTLFRVYRQGALVADFSVNQQLYSRLKKGQDVLYYPQFKRDAMNTGTIGLLEPVFRNGKSTGIARVYIDAIQLKVGDLVTGNVAVVFNKGWWLPKEAVWISGQDAIVFRKRGKDFEPAKVDLLDIVHGLALVKTDIGDWQVAANASFLADSESFIKVKPQNDLYEE